MRTFTAHLLGAKCPTRRCLACGRCVNVVPAGERAMMTGNVHVHVSAVWVEGHKWHERRTESARDQIQTHSFIYTFIRTNKAYSFHGLNPGP